MSSLTLRRGAAPVSGATLWLLLPLWLVVPLGAHAQNAPPPPTPVQSSRPPPNAPPNARMTEPVDFTGYWVSIVTEDWRYRMVTPDKGDFPGVPLNPAGRALAVAWDPSKDEASGEQCKSYGAGAIMRVPTRLHITWVNDNSLRVDTDAGTQTRTFYFNGAAPAAGPPTWQGSSVATWEGLSRARGFEWGVVATGAAPRRPGYLKVMTRNLKAGYLRKNGVPYSASATVEEYFDSFKETNGDTWLVVTSVVTDPQYLAQPFLTSSHFKKLAGASGWTPTPCETK